MFKQNLHKDTDRYLFINGHGSIHVPVYILLLLLSSHHLFSQEQHPLSSHSLINTLDSGLVAYYPFNGDARDRSGNGNDGIIKGARSTSDRFGNPRSALLFERVTDSVIVPPSSDFDFSDERASTISCWTCGTGDDGRMKIDVACHGGLGGTNCKLFRVTLGVKELTVTANVHSSECNISIRMSYHSAVNRWHHLACTVTMTSSPSTTTGR